MKPKLLDLFCCAGGASVGYHKSGFDVVGVDIKPQPNYPYPFILGDAVDVLNRMLQGERFQASDDNRYRLDDFDFIHASPPCQAYMDTNKGGAKPSKHPRLIEPIRDLLLKTGKMFVIENVHLAPVRHDLMLCGTMFDLRVIRHRYFECSDPPPCEMKCNHWGTVAGGDFVGVYAFGGRGHRHGKGRRDGPPMPAKVTAAEAMGIHWMKQKELFEAIPPAYTKFIGDWAINRLNTIISDVGCSIECTAEFTGEHSVGCPCRRASP